MQKWTTEQVKSIFNLPLSQILYEAQTIHRKHFAPDQVQISTLLSIKTGSCPENCSYCPQSAHYQTGIQKKPLMALADVLLAAQQAKQAGASRFCMGAAWRGPRDEHLDQVCVMVAEVKKLGLETCVTLGLLKDDQALRLKAAGLDFYNHNIDTSENFYNKIITTRTLQDRLDTLAKVRQAGIKVCCGGIIGMGEDNDDRINMLVILANLDEPPESVPINQLIRIPGTPLATEEHVDPFDFIKTIATARIIMPHSYIRLSAGREQMSDEMQALCFLAGANSIFYGEKLLTTDNPIPEQDQLLFKRLGIKQLQLEPESNNLTN